MLKSSGEPVGSQHQQVVLGEGGAVVSQAVADGRIQADDVSAPIVPVSGSSRTAVPAPSSPAGPRPSAPLRCVHL